MRCTCCGEWTIEVVHYDLAPRNRGGSWLRLSWGRSIMGECRTINEMEKIIGAWSAAPPLANFHEER
jgi:hypothetical protein